MHAAFNLLGRDSREYIRHDLRRLSLYCALVPPPLVPSKLWDPSSIFLPPPPPLVQEKFKNFPPANPLESRLLLDNPRAPLKRGINLQNGGGGASLQFPAAKHAEESVVNSYDFGLRLTFFPPLFEMKISSDRICLSSLLFFRSKEAAPVD